MINCGITWYIFKSHINPNPLGCVQNSIEIGGFGTVRVLKDFCLKASMYFW